VEVDIVGYTGPAAQPRALAVRLPDGRMPTPRPASRSPAGSASDPPPAWRSWRASSRCCGPST
jgi:hypothetical protein